MTKPTKPKKSQNNKKSSGSGNGSGVGGWVMSLAVGCVGALVYWFAASSTSSSSSDPRPFHVHRIPHVHEPEDLSSLMSQATKPFTFTGGPPDRWATQQWLDDDELVQRLPVLDNVKSSPAASNRFVYHSSDRTWAGSATNVSVLPSVPMQCFLGSCPDVADDVLLYKTLRLQDSGRLGDDVTTLAGVTVGDASPMVNLWFGRKGALTTVHYDMEHNVFCQVRGRKRFVLVPPTSIVHEFVPFPWAHPNWRQMAVLDPVHLDVAAHPRLANLSAYEVEVGPGECMYLPPMFLHSVETLENSVSVNVWSPSGVYTAFDRVMSLGERLPFDAQWPPEVMVAVVRTYLHTVLNSAFQSIEDGARGFLADLLRTRYGHLFAHSTSAAAAAAAAAANATSTAPSPRHPFTAFPPDSLWLDVLGSDLASRSLQELEDPASGSRAQLRTAARSAVEALAPLSPTTRFIIAGDHVEQVCVQTIQKLRAQDRSEDDASTDMENLVDPRDTANDVWVEDDVSPSPLELLIFIRDAMMTPVYLPVPTSKGEDGTEPSAPERNRPPPTENKPARKLFVK